MRVRRTGTGDIAAILDLSREIYPPGARWREEELRSHLDVFPEGQLVAEAEGEIVGMAASLIILWEDYDIHGSWWEFTGHGLFTNHDPVNGRTLYGAGVMVSPRAQGRGIGSTLYRARRRLARDLGIRRIRAGARLCRYHLHADRLSPAGYVDRVLAGEIDDPVLRFQLRHGFKILAVVRDYLPQDPESLGHAAVIEWLDPDSAPGAPR